MEYIKKHKLTAFIVFVYIIVIAFGFFVYNLFIGSSGNPVYGDRLDGIEDVPITDEQKDKIAAEIEKESFVIKVTQPYLSGRILKVIVTVTDNAELAASKKLSEKIVAELTDDQKKFYDVEIFVKKLYNCTITATGKVDEDGNFVDTVKVKFENDLDDVKSVESYGLSTKSSADYNKEQSMKITDDGEFIIYGYTKDKGGESKCSIKIVKKSGDKSTEVATIDSKTSRNFPIIGYKKLGKDGFSWTKDR